MKVLLDTNVVLRVLNSTDAIHRTVTAGVQKLVSLGMEPCICSQVVVELWAVCTRPAASNGLGIEPRELRPAIERVIQGFRVLEDPPELLGAWLDLCASHEVRGRQTFDARLVALMSLHNVQTLVTLNPVDFARYPMVETIVPTV